jgi:hypothetical protein
MIKGVYGDEIISLIKQDQYGGIDINLRTNSPYADDIRWLSKFRREYEAEKRLRETNQAVQKAYEHYEMIKMLAQKEKETV